MHKLLIPLSSRNRNGLQAYRYTFDLLVCTEPGTSKYVTIPFVIDCASERSILPVSFLAKHKVKFPPRLPTPKAFLKSIGNDYVSTFDFQFQPNQWLPPGCPPLYFISTECRVTTSHMKRGHLSLFDLYPSFDPAFERSRDMRLDLRHPHQGHTLRTQP